jgi:two-component system LytT family response regulator
VLRAIVIDDEKASISQFNKIAKQNSKVDLLGAFTNPLEGLMSIGTNKPNVVFLDINMPEMSGIYLAEQIIKLYPKTYIVFITANFLTTSIS